MSTNRLITEGPIGVQWPFDPVGRMAPFVLPDGRRMRPLVEDLGSAPAAAGQYTFPFIDPRNEKYAGGIKADGGYLLPYSGSNLDMVTGLVLGGDFRSDLRTILGNVEMPSFNANLLTADELQTRGDANVTLVVTDPRFQYFNQTLTANRTITLPNTSVTPGLEFHVIRYASTPGAFTLQVVDPLSAKSYTFASGTRGFAKYRAVSSGEWLLVEAGTFP